MHIPMSSPDLTDVERQAVWQVLDTTYLSIGPRLDAFERAVASYVGAAHGVGVNSGTSGLHLCVIAAGVEERTWSSPPRSPSLPRRTASCTSVPFLCLSM